MWHAVWYWFVVVVEVVALWVVAVPYLVDGVFCGWWYGVLLFPLLFGFVIMFVLAIVV